MTSAFNNLMTKTTRVADVISSAGGYFFASVAELVDARPSGAASQHTANPKRGLEVAWGYGALWLLAGSTPAAGIGSRPEFTPRQRWPRFRGMVRTTSWSWAKAGFSYPQKPVLSASAVGAGYFCPSSTRRVVVDPVGFFAGVAEVDADDTAQQDRCGLGAEHRERRLSSKSICLSQGAMGANPIAGFFHYPRESVSSASVVGTGYFLT